LKAKINLALRVLLALAAGYVVILQACYFFGAYGVRRHQVESACFIFAAIVFLRFLTLKGPDWRSTSPSVARWVFGGALLGVAAYWRALNVGLLSDDFVLRSWVLAGHLTWVDSKLARPVALALWRAVFGLGGDAVSLHVVNVALHVTNTILAGHLAARLGLERSGVLVASLVFLLWPTQVEAVVWSSGVFDVLATTWMLGALLICLRDAALFRTSVDVVLVCGLSVLALLTKESAVALSLLAMVVTLGRPAHGFASRRQTILVISILCSTVAYMAWRLSAGLPVVGTSSVGRYVVKEQLSRTFGALALPFSDQTVHAHPLLALLIASGIAVLATASIIHTKQRSPGHVIAMKGVIWGVVAPLPTIGLLFIGSYLDGSRYLYLAALGWGLVLGGLLDALWQHRFLRWVAITGLAALFVAVGVEQQQRLSDWQAAASERDRILAEARRLAGERHCGSIEASNLPPRHNGAQLFNNGFANAIGEALPTTPSSHHCRWTWDGSAFREN
jgi:hypothetical protein